MNLPLALLWFLVGFLAVNGLKTLHILRSSKKIQQKLSNNGISSSESIKKAYQKSLPFIPLYYLLIWIICSIFYFHQHESPRIYLDALNTGILWWLLTLLLEMLVWVIFNHKLKLSWKEMYMNSQPWLSISYYAVLISPIVISLIIR